MTDIPLVVDLDGTLCRTDTLHEALLGLASADPKQLLSLSQKRGDKAAFKRQVADHKLLDPALLPYDDDVLALIRKAKDDGRTVALVSASDHRQVSAVADHLGLFDLVIGTGAADTTGNLAGDGKRQVLIDRFGDKGFDYIGDSAADLPVWAAARTALGVRVSGDVAKAAASQGTDLTHVGARATGWPIPALIRACRPHQWAKNVLILLPVFTSFQFGAIFTALLAMLCFSLSASAIYLINDLVDLPSDRAHPRKCKRPFAAGEATALQGALLAAGLLGVSLLASLIFLPGAFVGVLLIYLVATTAYSFALKRKMMVDVLMLAALYTLRIIAGGAATGVLLSPWLLVFSMFLFFSLATIKRQAELEDMATRGKEKTSGRNLLVTDLPVLQGMSITAAQAATLVFALYSQDPEIQSHFQRPDLLLFICPVLFFWLGRMQLLTRRGFMTDDPIVFTFRDRVSLISGVIMMMIFAVAGGVIG